MDLSRAAQEKIREATELVDNFAKAKSELEPLGMTVVEAKVDEFRKVAQQKIWPAYKSPVRRAVGRDRRLQGLSKQRGAGVPDLRPPRPPYPPPEFHRACCVSSQPSRKSRSRR